MGSKVSDAMWAVLYELELLTDERCPQEEIDSLHSVFKALWKYHEKYVSRKGTR